MAVVCPAVTPHIHRTPQKSWAMYVPCCAMQCALYGRGMGHAMARYGRGTPPKWKLTENIAICRNLLRCLQLYCNICDGLSGIILDSWCCIRGFWDVAVCGKIMTIAQHYIKWWSISGFQASHWNRSWLFLACPRLGCLPTVHSCLSIVGYMYLSQVPRRLLK